MGRKNAIVKIYLLLTVTMLFWGGTFIAGRVLAGSVPPAEAAFFRFAIASLSLAVLVYLIEGRIPRVKRDKILPLLLLGLTGVFSYNICFFTGLKYIEAGRASLIIALNPLTITIFAVAFLGERFSFSQVCGLVLSLLGAFVVISNGHLSEVFSGGFGRGEAAILGCVISWAAYSLIGRTVLSSMSPLTAVFYSALLGAVMLLAYTLASGVLPAPAAYSLNAWLSLIFLGFFGTAAGFTMYYHAIKTIGAARSSVFINLVPLFSILLAWIILNEVIKISVLAGGAILLTGVYLTNRAPLTRKRPVVPEGKKR